MIDKQGGSGRQTVFGAVKRGPPAAEAPHTRLTLLCLCAGLACVSLPERLSAPLFQLSRPVLGLETVSLPVLRLSLPICLL